MANENGHKRNNNDGNRKKNVIANTKRRNKGRNTTQTHTHTHTVDAICIYLKWAKSGVNNFRATSTTSDFNTPNTDSYAKWRLTETHTKRGPNYPSDIVNQSNIEHNAHRVYVRSDARRLFARTKKKRKKKELVKAERPVSEYGGALFSAIT